MTLSEVMVRLTGVRLRTLAAELGVEALDDAPDAAVMEIVLDRLGDRREGVEWVLSRLTEEERKALAARQN